MDYAVIKTGGKQYRVFKNDVIEVERLNAFKQKDGVVFSDVLLLVSDKNVKIGKPTIKGASVKGTVLDQMRGEKIRVAKYKAKVRYRRVMGHRQALTRVKIEEIISV